MKNRSTTQLAILSLLACFTLLPAPKTFGVTPAPDGCYPNFTTAEGCDALDSLTTGVGNTGLGWRALFTNTTGNFNTAVGVGALVLNNSNSNTAVGAAALLLNDSGTQNTAVGSSALVFNTTGDSNTATGYAALMDNTTGGANTAVGWEALAANTTGINNVALGTLPLANNTIGNNNTAIGNLALTRSVITSEHVCVGRLAGSLITNANNNIIIGHHTGVHSTFGQEDNVCYIGNIYGANVDNTGQGAFIVLVDPDGRLGTVPVAAGGSPGKAPAVQPQAIPDGANQALFDRKVKKLRATVVQQQHQIEILMAQLKENAAQIRKANAQLEIDKPAAKIVANKP